MSASPAMAREVMREAEPSQVLKIRRDTLVWLATVLLQLLALVYSYGRLSERVDNQKEQLNRIELRMNELSGHK